MSDWSEHLVAAEAALGKIVELMAQGKLSTAQDMAYLAAIRAHKVRIELMRLRTVGGVVRAPA